MDNSAKRRRLESLVKGTPLHNSPANSKRQNPYMQNRKLDFDTGFFRRQLQLRCANLEAENFHLRADNQRASQQLNEQWTYLSDKEKKQSQIVMDFAHRDSKEKDLRISHLLENHKNIYTYFEDKTTDLQKGHEVALKKLKEDVSQRQSVIEGLLQEVKALKDENVNLKKLTEDQAKEFDCFQKSTDEKLKDSQKDLDSLKESVAEAQNENQRYEALDEERKKSIEDLESLRNRHEEEKAETETEVSGVTILKMAKEQLVNKLQTEIGQLKTTIADFKRENEALKVNEEKHAAELKQQDEIVAALKQEIKTEKKMSAQKELKASKAVEGLMFRLGYLRYKLEEESTKRELLSRKSEMCVKNLESEKDRVKRSLENPKLADKKHNILVLKNLDAAGRIQEQEINERAKEKEEFERAKLRKDKHLNSSR